MTRTLSALATLLAFATVNAPPALADDAPKAKPDITLSGHTSVILDLAFSPDGKQLASVADDGKLKVWDPTAKKELFTVDGIKNNANRVRFTPDGKSVVCLGSDNTVVVIDAEAGKPRKPIAVTGLTGGTSSLDLSPDGKTVAVSGRGTVRLFDLATGTAGTQIEAHRGYAVADVAFSADGKAIATVGSDNAANLFDAVTGKPLHAYKLPLNGVAVAMSRDGKTLFAAVSDRTLQSIDVATGETKKLIDKGVVIQSLAVTDDGKSLLVGGPGRCLMVVKLPEQTVSDSPVEAETWVHAAAASKDGQWQAAGGHVGDVYVWKVTK